MSLPEPAYLQKLGEVVYRVSGIEWLVLSDLNGLNPPLSGFDIGALSGKTTRQIADLLRTVELSDQPEQVANFVAESIAYLTEISHDRNHLLHARPATEVLQDGASNQRLYRWRMNDAQSDAFFVTDAWVEGLIERLDQIIHNLTAIRPGP